MHFDVVLSEFIHPFSKMRRRAQFSIRADLTRLSVCVRVRCVCVLLNVESGVSDKQDREGVLAEQV